MTTAALSAPAASGAITVTLSSYSATCIPTIYYRLNDQATPTEVRPTASAPSGTNVTSFVVAQSGATTVEYWSKDLSGNEEPHMILNVPVAPPAPRVVMTATPLTVIYPTIVTLTARASYVDTTVAYFEVRYATTETTSTPKVTNWSGWSAVGTVESDTGTFVLLQLPLKRAEYRVRIGGIEATPNSNVFVSANMAKPRASRTVVKVGVPFTVSGAFRPKHPAVDPPAADTKYKVRFWKYNSRKRVWAETSSVNWKIAGYVSNDMSRWTYSRTFTASQAGLWRVAFFHECPRHKAATSPTLAFSVVR